VCNAVETLLVHDDIAAEFLPAIADRYETADVEIRGDERTRELADVEAATEADWDTEYGDLIVSIGSSTRSKPQSIISPPTARSTPSRS